MKPIRTAASPTVEHVMRESREALLALRDEALAAGDRERAEWIGRKIEEVENEAARDGVSAPAPGLSTAVEKEPTCL